MILKIIILFNLSVIMYAYKEIAASEVQKTLKSVMQKLSNEKRVKIAYYIFNFLLFKVNYPQKVSVFYSLFGLPTLLFDLIYRRLNEIFDKTIIHLLFEIELGTAHHLLTINIWNIIKRAENVKFSKVLFVTLCERTTCLSVRAENISRGIVTLREL